MSSAARLLLGRMGSDRSGFLALLFFFFGKVCDGGGWAPRHGTNKTLTTSLASALHFLRLVSSSAAHFATCQKCMMQTALFLRADSLTVTEAETFFKYLTDTIRAGDK